MGDFYQIPVATLKAIGSNLSSVKSEIDAVERGAQGLEGVDDVCGDQLAHAVDCFFHEWKTSRRRLLENVEKLGQVSNTISDQTAQFDDEVAGKLREIGGKISGGS
ncbi:hypothetical protein [Corynebacterium heidelbergense]|uniref:ESX-1 secretion-associated protein n=1 Tax=Corynebacterium heidelbergense TaxID=2055947 RepID=A0A364V4H2_9CORY|nr:hypothetical protein [Corynebacterium heidelbergense]RAV31518.1 hypothetical protein DLJ54_07925 [Corynebacterium heidelbergense]